MEEEWRGRPQGVALVKDLLFVMGGRGLTYQPRRAELYGAYLYLYDSDHYDECTRIHLQALSITDNSDDKNGFTLLSFIGGGKHKTKFKCSSLDQKRTWVTHLHNAISDATGDETLQTMVTSANAKFELDRRDPPLIEGLIEKRGGWPSSYHPRWCEVRRNVGLIYGKSREAPDSTFKIVPLRGKTINTAEEKLRIGILGTEGEIFLKFANVDDFQKWHHMIQLEVKGIAEPPKHPTAEIEEMVVEEELDEETQLELADLQSREPVKPKKKEEKKPHKEAAAFGPLYLESICQEYHPTRNTPGYETELQHFLDTVVTYGLAAMLDRFQERMFVPISKPFARVNEHINLLDLDASQLRKVLADMLELHGQEEAARPHVERTDAVLRTFTVVRERLLIRREIAAFCEQPGKCGLKPGLLGTVAAISAMTHKERGMPTTEQWEKVQRTLSLLVGCLDQFRYEFDIFDEACDTIVEVQTAINTAQQWLLIHRPLEA